MGMIPMEEINVPELKSAIKNLYMVGAIPAKINTFGYTKEKALKKFLDAIDNMSDEDGEKLTDEIIEFYNSLFTDEEDDDEVSEDAPEVASDEKDIGEDGEEDEEEVEDDLEDEAEEEDEPEEEEVEEPKVRPEPEESARFKRERKSRPIPVEDKDPDEPKDEPIKKPKREPKRVVVGSKGKNIDRDILVDILKTTKAATAKASVLPQMEHFIFSDGNVIGYNDDLFICQPLDTDLECSVNATDLMKIINKSHGDVIILSEQENELSIVSDDMESGLSTIKGNTLNELVEEVLDDAVNWKEIPEDFQNGAYLVSHSASSTTGANTLNCVHVKDTQITACDRIRVGRYKMNEPMDTFMIRAAVIPELENFNMNSYCVTDSWVHFKSEETGKRLSARRVLGEYPSVTGFFDVDFNEEIKLPADLKDVVDSVSTIQNELITITIKDNVLTCKAKKANGWMKRSLSVQKCPPMQFSVNPKMLSKALDGTLPSLSVGDGVILLTFDTFEQILYTLA